MGTLEAMCGRLHKAVSPGDGKRPIIILWIAAVCSGGKGFAAGSSLVRECSHSKG